jgi:hypothetical protein
MLSLRTSRWRSASPSPRGDERLGILRQQSPAAGPVVPVRLRRGQTRGRVHFGQCGERGAHGLRVAVAPGRRPPRVGEILEDEERQAVALAVAVEVRQERAVDVRVDNVLEPEPARRQLVDGGLDEDAPSVVEHRAQAACLRVAAAGDALERDDPRIEEPLQLLVHAASFAASARSRACDRRSSRIAAAIANPPAIS